MLVLNAAQTEDLLDPDDLRGAVASAMAELSAGTASVPPRIAARVDDVGGMLLAMPAYLPDVLGGGGGLAAKLVSLFPLNAATGRPTHQAVIVVFDVTTGEPTALMDGTVITAARTAAGSALSVELLARQESKILAILGTGVQARWHAHAVVRVRPFDHVRVAGRDIGRTQTLARQLNDMLDADVRPSPTYEHACRGADVICAATHSPSPVVRREDVAPGTHITSVGYNISGRELDSRIVADATVVVESRAAALAAPPAGSNDIRFAIEEGLITAGHIHAEIGELVAGTRPGRESASAITLYKSVGIAVQDVAAAALVLAAARAHGVGVDVAL